MSHIIPPVFDVQSYELLIYLCGRGDAARDKMELLIIVCAASFFSFFPFFSLYIIIAGFSPCGASEKNSSAALKPGLIATLSCINSRGGAYLFHVYLPGFTPVLHLIIFTALVMQTEK